MCRYFFLHWWTITRLSFHRQNYQKFQYHQKESVSMSRSSLMIVTRDLRAADFWVIRPWPKLVRVGTVCPIFLGLVRFVSTGFGPWIPDCNQTIYWNVKRFLVNYPFYLINRYMRLTPMILMVAWFAVSISPIVADGKNPAMGTYFSWVFPYRMID